jgi:hypothetical protein
MVTTARSDRGWQALRGLSAAVIRRALGDGWELFDDPTHGVSVRRRGGGWDWPEWALADRRQCDLDEARRLLLDTGRRLSDEMRQPGRAGARARVAAFIGVTA